MQPFTCSNPTAVVSLSYLIFLVTTPCLATSNIGPHLDNYNDFINTSCQVTRYPRLCFNTLSPYATTIQTSPTELANAALNVSLESAKSTSTTVLELSKGADMSPREVQAMRDCLEDMGDSIDELHKSLVAMKDLDGPDFEEKMGNLMTWVSAALTDEDTCMDGFEEHAYARFGKDGKIKSQIRKNIVNLAELTSNALALINHISSN